MDRHRLRATLLLWISTLWILGVVGCLVAQEPLEQLTPATGPLRVHPQNARYFANGSGQAILLTGSHVWNNLVDMGRDYPPAAFDFHAYLDFLQRRRHNFIRLWAWDSTIWDTQANGALGKNYIHHAAPLPWLRTGPGQAADGQPRFDLTKFDPAYFERLRTRTEAAGRRGIYVSVMLFEGWGLFHGSRGKPVTESWAWKHHPFHRDNNLQGIHAADAEGKKVQVHSLAHPQVNELQAAYIRRVIDTVNDLDNILYEVINEGGDKDWDWWVVKTTNDYQRTKPQQHPVGITGHGAERLDSMLASPADWVSPGRADGFAEDPPAWNHDKVSLLDTDHVWGVGGNPDWVWKSFVRGHNPLFMDPYDNHVLGKVSAMHWEGLRMAMGHVQSLASRVDLAAMQPYDALSSTHYCLAQPGVTYIVFVPEGGEVQVDLTAGPGPYSVDWIRPVDGTSTSGERVKGGAERTFQPPFRGSAALWLRRTDS